MAKRTTARTSKAPARRRRATAAGDNVHLPNGMEVTTRDLGLVSRVFWMCHKNRVELAPPAAAALLWTTSAAVKLAHEPVVGLVAAGALAGFTWWAAPKKWDRDEEVLYARAVTVAASLWLIAACIVGPVNPVVFWALVLGAVGAAVPWYRHKLARPQKSDPLTSEWAAKWVGIRDRLGVLNSEVDAAKGDENYAEITIQLKNGQTYSDIGDQAETIASLLGLPSKAIKIRDCRKTNASKVVLVYTRVSVIDSLINWSDAAHLAPKSIAQPIVLGRRETGDWKTVDARGHWMIVGQTRGGKSNEIHALMANLTETDDTVIFFADLKGGSVGGRWRECVDWFATTLEEVDLMFGSVNQMIDARAAAAPVGDGDGDQLTPSPDLPAVVVVFDECAEGLGVKPGSVNQSIRTRITGHVESISRRGAAMNFYLILAGQDGSLETYGTERLRGNLTRRLCFRVARQDSAQYVLSDYTRFTVKELENGQFYYHERADDPVPIRGPFMTPPENPHLPQDIARRNAARRPQLDAATAVGGGDAYATRHGRVPAKHQTYGQAASAVPARREDTEMSEQGMTAAQARAAAIEAEAYEGPAVTPEDLAAVAGQIDLAKDVEDATELWCRLLANAPVSGVKAQNLYETVGTGRTWSNDRLTVLKDRGLVENVRHGHWRAAPGATAESLRAALDEWQAGTRALIPA